MEKNEATGKESHRELKSKPSNVVPLVQKETKLPYQTPEQLMEIAFL